MTVTLIAEVVTKQEEEDIVKYLDSQVWDTTLSRRTQHYGYQYMYKTRSLANTVPIPQQLLPDVMLGRCDPEQLIVNEYKKGQGISPHIDSSVFGDKIFVLSLLDDVEFHLGEETMTLPRRSLLILDGDDRWKKQHHLRYNGTRRISLTYRILSK